jgi:hypothetical protein
MTDANYCFCCGDYTPPEGQYHFEVEDMLGVPTLCWDCLTKKRLASFEPFKMSLQDLMDRVLEDIRQTIDLNKED